MSVTAGAAPLHCLSKYKIIRTASSQLLEELVEISTASECTLIDLIVIFRPILSLSPVPAGMRLRLELNIAPAVAVGVDVLLVSKNFSSVSVARRV